MELTKLKALSLTIGSFISIILIRRILSRLEHKSKGKRVRFNL